ncbi:MAG: bifunctional UDP-N-acetylglucosamine diphosphorylase/glucosamine-1-phosphate N-acetyltransferase GlmU [Chloroflexi bacterium]|nr:bifunctional UDP-N-acetylglucosamine diphosphorylase/glucosamine-1-phosphate N-acetyltransferase GlmU [Chloroflexota bacterium]
MLQPDTDWAAVILVAGEGSRMNSDLPKVLHPVCGREMVRHVLDALGEVHAGLVVAVVAPGATAVRDSLGDLVEYVEQPDPRGTGHALLQAEELLQGRASNILVLYGDTPLLLPATLAEIMEHHQSEKAAVTILTSRLAPPDGLGRVVRDDASGRITKVVEERVADETELAISEINGGAYAFDSRWLWPALRKIALSEVKEYFLTDIVNLAAGAGAKVESVESREAMEVLGVNDRVQLSQAERAMRERILRRWMLAGVTIIDPDATYIQAGVTLGRDTTIHPNTTLNGATTIGKRCVLGPGAAVYDSVVGDDCTIGASVLEGAHLESRVNVGPFSHLRPGTVLEHGVFIGNYAEIKNSRLGRGTVMGHFSYVGDADVGEKVNIGAGAVTCNFDGVSKNRTIIEDRAFIGSDTMLVAPVRIGAGATTAAGSVVNRDVPPGSVAIGVPARIKHSKKDPDRAAIGPELGGQSKIG